MSCAGIVTVHPGPPGKWQVELYTGAAFLGVLGQTYRRTTFIPGCRELEEFIRESKSFGSKEAALAVLDLHDYPWLHLEGTLLAWTTFPSSP